MTTPQELQPGLADPDIAGPASADDAAAHPDLVQSAHGLRNVARALVGDTHVAEDVVQDTLCQALRRDLQPGPLHGWLRRTAENFARQWRRGERRRANRERTAEQREHSQSPAELTSRRETLQRVTTALLSLDEPYQTTVFMRYFEDLPPRAIARRTETNLATVKSRLQRGLAMLRTRLDQMTGGDRREWRLALVGTFALGSGTTAATLLTTGTILMGTTTKLLLAAGTLAALGICFYGLGNDPAPTPVATKAASDAPDAATAASTGSAMEAAAQREAVEPAPTATPWLDHPYSLALETRFVDELGLPVEGRSVAVALSNCEINRSSTTSNALGIATIQLASRVPELEVIVRDEQRSLRRVTLRHGRTNKITMLVSRRTISAGTFTITLLDLPRLNKGTGFRVFPGSTPHLGEGLHPHARFEIPAGVASYRSPKPGAPVRVTNFAAAAREQPILMALPAPGNPTNTDDAASTARIVGSVFGSDGKPRAKETVALIVDGKPITRTLTNEHGQFEFSGLSEGHFELRAGGGDNGLGTTTAVTTAGTTRADLHLELGSLIRGVALAADGSPLANLSVVWEAADGSWVDGAKTKKDGSFVIPNLPGASGHLALWHEGRKFPTVVNRDVLADAGSIELREPAAQGALQFEPAHPDATKTFALARLWEEATGRGTTVKGPAPGKPWGVKNLAAGWYRLELFHRELGTVDAGRHWVDDDGICDLGRVLMPEPASLELSVKLGANAASAAVELCRIGRDLDARFTLGEIDSNNRIYLAPGDYAVFWRDAGDEVHHKRFTATRGKSTRVKIER